MKTRILTACVGVPLLVAVLVLGGWIAEAMAEIVTLMAMWECYHALKEGGYKPCTWGGYAAAALMCPLAWLFGIRDPLIYVTAAMGISLTGVILSDEPTFPNAAVSIYPIFTALLPFVMFMMMMNTKFGLVPGRALVVMSFAVSFIGDAAAYFGGRALGRHKLCPTVSPKKTVEGAVFYFIGGVIASLVCRAVFVCGFGTPMPGIPAAVILGLIGSAAGQIGDLTASLLKRHVGIKDYGKILPGHGGIMDRFDSFILTLVVFYCYTLLLH